MKNSTSRFSIIRILHLIKNDFIANTQSILTACITIACLMLVINISSIASSAYWDLNRIFFPICLLLGGCIATSFAFSNIQKKGQNCTISIRSDCGNIEKLSAQLREVDPYQEISFSGDGPNTFIKFRKWCPHPACSVPVGIIKAVEVAAGLALPQDVTIEVSGDDA